MSEIIDKARKSLEYLKPIGVCFVNRRGRNEDDTSQHDAYSAEDVAAALDYAEELEKRLKRLTSCNLCKHCDVIEDCAPCKDCIAARTYPLWEFAPKETL